MTPEQMPNMRPDFSMDKNDALMKRHAERAETDAPIQNKNSQPSIARTAYDVGQDGKLAKYGLEVPYLGYLVFSVKENPDDPEGKLQTVGLSLVTIEDSIFD